MHEQPSTDESHTEFMARIRAMSSATYGRRAIPTKPDAAGNITFYEVGERLTDKEIAAINRARREALRKRKGAA